MGDGTTAATATTIVDPVTVAHDATHDLLVQMKADALAKLGEKSRTYKAASKELELYEKRGLSKAWSAPAVAYHGEEVLDRLTAIQNSNEELLSKGGTIILKITGGDVRKLSLLPNQVRHVSGNGMRRITQASPSGRNEAPRCVNIVDLPDGSFQISAGNEMAFEMHKGKVWE